jgi:hypothetical protein
MNHLHSGVRSTESIEKNGTAGLIKDLRYTAIIRSAFDERRLN